MVDTVNQKNILHLLCKKFESNIYKNMRFVGQIFNIFPNHLFGMNVRAKTIQSFLRYIVTIFILFFNFLLPSNFS